MALDYGLRYYKLAGVKESLYHPKLPTFRRMDMDTAAHKLPDEHCRTTTPCTRGDFSNRAVTMQLKSSKPLYQTFPQVNRHWRYRNLYSYRLDDQKADNDIECNKAGQPINDVAPLKASNQAALAPNTLQSAPHPWKFVLQQEPFIDHSGQRPIPATTFSRYRSTSSRYGGQVSSRSWRP